MLLYFCFASCRRKRHLQHCASHLDVWVQCLDVCCNACDQAATANGHKDGIKLGGVCNLRSAQQQQQQQLGQPHMFHILLM
jgi:hypothetical protein